MVAKLVVIKYPAFGNTLTLAAISDINMRKILFIATLLFISKICFSQQSIYTIDFYIGYLRYQNDSVHFESPKHITTTTSGLTNIISIGRTINYEFGIKVEILKSRFQDTLSYIVGKAYYIKKAGKWEEILKFCHDWETVALITERIRFSPPKYVWGGGSTLEPIEYEVRQNDYYYISK